MPTDVRATSPRQTSVRHVAHRRPSGARPTAVRAASAYLVTRGCSVRRCRLVPPDPTARPPSGARPARPLAAHAANARLVTRGCSVPRWRLVPPDPTARPPSGARPARPLTAHAASFARRVVSKPGQAPQASRHPPVGRPLTPGPAATHRRHSHLQPAGLTPIQSDNNGGFAALGTHCRRVAGVSGF